MKNRKKILCFGLSFIILFATACSFSNSEGSYSQIDNSSINSETVYYEGIWVEIFDQDGVVIKYPKLGENYWYNEYKSGVVFYDEYSMNMNPYMVPTYEQEKSLILKLGEVVEEGRQASLESFLQNGEASKYEEKKNSYCELASYIYVDLDGNGTMELFATVHNGIDTYILYYVSEDVVVELERMSFAFGVPKIVDMKERQFVQFDFHGTTSHISFVYNVADDLPYETSVSGQMISGVNTYNELVLRHSTLDASFNGDASYGRTWKPYYFYLASDGDFREYGGIEITLQDVYKIEGAAELLDDLLTEEYEVTTVYYRGNGIININRLAGIYDENSSMFYGGENSYITLRITENGIVVEEVASGVYSAALIPEIADYPKKNELPF